MRRKITCSDWFARNYCETKTKIMAVKGQKTKSTFMEWDTMQVLIRKLERDREFKFAMLIGAGCYLGLRISDLLTLRWEDLLYQKQLHIIEKKTKKSRTIAIHTELQEQVQRMYKGQDKSQYIFINKDLSDHISIQYVNRRLKQIAKKYRIDGQFSSHFMRKTLGRRVWAKNNYSEKSIVMLSTLFNHSNIKTTKIYLGIQDKEINDIYLNL